MMPLASIQPPRLAVWLVDLFNSDKEADPIRGDLLEEFSPLVSKSGVAGARSWYWRQAAKTIAHLVGIAFRVAPLRIPGAVLLGLVLLRAGFRLWEQLIMAVLARYRFPDVPRTALVTLWVPLAIQIGCVIVAMSVGCVVALAVKGAEMVTTMTLAPAFYVVTGVGHVMWVAMRLPEFSFFWPQEIVVYVVYFAPHLALFTSIAIVMAGVVIRTCRSSAAHRFSGA
jgi:hypothetical protein